MFNPTSPSVFSVNKPPAGITTPKPQAASSPNNPFIAAGQDKTKPKDPSTPSVTFPKTSPMQETANVTATDANKATALPVGGGKLDSDKPGTTAVDGLIAGKIQVDQPTKPSQEKILSPLSQLKEDHFLCSKIKSGTLTDKDTQNIIGSFELLTSDEITRKKAEDSMKTPQGRDKLIDIRYLHNSTEDVRKWLKHYFSLLISQLMHQNQFLSFKGALTLLLRYLAINKDVFCPGEKFKIQTIVKQCNIKVLNEIPSSIKSEPYFKKMVKEISFMKDTFFLQYSRFFKLLNSHYLNEETYVANNKPLTEKKFLSTLGKITWKNFEYILKSQKKQLKNFYELNIMLVGLQAIIHLNPQAFDQRTLKQSILPTLADNFKLIESSKRIKLNLVDQFFLHIMLIHPFTSESKYRLDSSLNRYAYLRFFSEQSVKLMPLQSAGETIFIEKVLQSENQFDSYERQFEYFVFTSIINIIKDDPQRFWKEGQSYRYIKSYIWHIQKIVQAYSQEDPESDYKQYYDYYYQCMCRFAQIINLLCFPSISQYINPEKVVKNKYIIREFIGRSFEMIKMNSASKQQLQEMLAQARLSTEPIYQFLHRLIIYDPNNYVSIKLEIEGPQTKENIPFQWQLFGSYLMQYSQNGLSTHTCVLAITRLIQGRYAHQVSNIMQYFAEIDKTHELITVNQIQKQISQLQYIIVGLLKKSHNYIPLARNILSILKYQPHLNEHPWMDRLLSQFKDLPQRYHPDNISQYAVILQVCLKFVQNSPKSMMKVQQFFNFKFANRYLCHILEVSFDNKTIFNKYMVGAVYQNLSIAVKLLKAMTELYLKEKDSNLGELVPYEIRKLLQSQNKDGSYQIIMRNTAISYHLALTTLLLSRQLKFDCDLHYLFPNLKNQILQTLINLNYINLDLKHENSLKITILYNKQQEDEINKAINVKSDLFEAIAKEPTYLGLEYLISSGTIDFKQKKSMFERVKQIEIDQSYSNIRSKSHFILVYWNQIQNSKLSIELSKGWEYVKREIAQIVEFLDAKNSIQVISIEDKESMNEILKNLYSFSNLLKSSSKEYYLAFVLKNHKVFWNLKLNNHYILTGQHQTNSITNYHNSLLTFFNCRTFLSNQLFQKIFQEQKAHETLYQFLVDLLKVTYKKNYSLYNDVQILQILEFGIAFLIQLAQSDQKKLKLWLKDIKEELVNRPQRNTPILTKEIVILILLNSRLSEKIQPESVEFGNKDWLLMMNTVAHNRRYSSILITQLFNIYEMHPIFFASTCHYLAQTAKTAQLEQLYEVSHYKAKKYTVHTLIDILKKSIQSERSCYSVWIIEVLIEIFMNKGINPHVRSQFCCDIRVNVLTLSLIHERISELLAKIGSYYSLNFSNLWKSKHNDHKPSSQITFSQKQQLLAYLRLFTLVFFMSKQEKQSLILEENVSYECKQAQNDILMSFLQLIPLLGDLMKDDKKSGIKASQEWEKKVKNFDITKICTGSIKSSGIKQLNSQKISQIWKDKSSLELLDQVSNVQLTSICILWVSTLKQTVKENQQYSTLFFQNIEILEYNIEKFLKFMQNLRQKIFFLSQNKEIQPILNFISKKIYLGSVEVSKEMLFTNMPTLSSSLVLKYESIKDKLVQSFLLINSLTMQIIKCCLDKHTKIDARLVKMSHHLYRSCKTCKKIDVLLNIPGGLPFTTPPDYDSTRNDMTYTKSRTIWSQR